MILGSQQQQGAAVPRPRIGTQRHIRMSDPLWDAIERAARNLGMTASAWVREAAEEKLERQEPQALEQEDK
jgi:predicted DNA-binding protein